LAAFARVNRTPGLGCGGCLRPAWERTLPPICTVGGSAAALRIEAGRTPYDRGLTGLVGELSTRSEQFRTWWAAHNVKFHTTSAKILRHPAVGEFELTGEALTLPETTA
jgi:hypothetical protein